MAKSDRYAGRGCGALVFGFVVVGVAISNGWKGIATLLVALVVIAIALPLLLVANKWIFEEGKLAPLGWLLWLVAFCALAALALYLFVPSAF
jgi:hypothetical protein